MWCAFSEDGRKVVVCFLKIAERVVLHEVAVKLAVKLYLDNLLKPDFLTFFLGPIFKPLSSQATHQASLSSPSLLFLPPPYYTPHLRHHNRSTLLTNNHEIIVAGHYVFPPACKHHQEPKP